MMQMIFSPQLPSFESGRLLRRDSLTFVEKRMAKNKDHL